MLNKNVCRSFCGGSKERFYLPFKIRKKAKRQKRKKKKVREKKIYESKGRQKSKAEKVQRSTLHQLLRSPSKEGGRGKTVKEQQKRGENTGRQRLLSNALRFSRVQLGRGKVIIGFENTEWVTERQDGKCKGRRRRKYYMFKRGMKEMSDISISSEV